MIALRLEVRFFRTDADAEPVREWLKALPPEDRRRIGEDLKTVQFGWPLGMPVVDHRGGELWEVRTRLDRRIARVVFALEGPMMVRLRGFIKKHIKKQQRTPQPDLELARQRLKRPRRRGT